MRQIHPKASLGTLCALFGYTRQAFYDSDKHARKTSVAHMVVLVLVGEKRESMPMLGVRKLHHLLDPEFDRHGIKMGRDQLFGLLRFHGLLVRRRRRMVKTTESHHWLKKYPNLVENMTLTGPEQLWVSDITYIRTMLGFSYLSLITDAYSRKIVGYALHPTLEAVGCLKSLSMAIKGRKKKSLPFKLIHHSDRGIQYCSSHYVEMLEEADIRISMTQTGSPYDNALAERVNGIIKNEFYPNRLYMNHVEAEKAIIKNIGIYNDNRPHASIDYLTPAMAHEGKGKLEMRWKHYKKKGDPMDA